MPPKSNIPIRIGGSRTRSGCKTCRSRHVKCDEGRPRCANCQRRNRECIYGTSPTPSRYSTPPPLSQGLDPGASGAVQYLNQSAWPSLNTSINPQGSIQAAETNAIQHFVTFLGKELAGNFSDAVWCDVLPRVATYEPAIRHGIVAVATLDMNLRLNYDDARQRLDNLVLSHYGKAMQELNIRLEDVGNDSTKDVVLLFCILFAVFECMQSHYKSALRHISGGMKLLNEWHDKGQTRGSSNIGSYLDRSRLQAIFLSLDSQAIQMGAIDFRDAFSAPALQRQSQTPASFATLDDANLLLTQIFHDLSHWSNWVEPSTACGNAPEDELMRAEQQRIQCQLDAWDVAHQQSLHLFDMNATGFLLLAQREAMGAYFGRTADGPSELEWDKYLPLFEEATTYAEAYMQLTLANPQAPTTTSKSRTPLTTSMDIVLPLFLISTRCRNSSVRRRALKLLQACDRKEGIWDSRMQAVMAERMIESEESAALEDGFIPEMARMYMIDIKLGEERSAELSKKTLVKSTDGTRFRYVDSMKEDVAW